MEQHAEFQRNIDESTANIADNLKTSISIFGNIEGYLSHLKQSAGFLKVLNSSFGKFVSAIDLHSNSCQYPFLQKPRVQPPVSVNKPMTPASVLKRKSNEKVQVPEQISVVEIRSPSVAQRNAFIKRLTGLPKKYSAPLHKQRLSLIVVALSHQTQGLRIHEIGRVAGLSMLQANEYLNSLMKLKLVSRTKEPQGLTYKLTTQGSKKFFNKK